MPKKKPASQPEDYPPQNAAAAHEPDFESALDELESIVHRLEQGSGSLEEALQDYSMAIELIKVCRKKLESTERRIDILCGFDADGNPVTEPLPECEDDLDSKREARSSRRSARSSSPSPAQRSSYRDSELF